MNLGFHFSKALLLLGLAAMSACSDIELENPWFDAGKQTLAQRLAVKPDYRRAKNVILFIGDGMGVSTVTATRIYDGQSRGEHGEENVLPFETFPHVALIKTYNANQQVADSAGSGAAMHTGVKTRAGVLGISEQARRGDCGNGLKFSVPTMAEYAKKANMSVGIVTTTRLTHATPASVFAHSPEREWESDAELSDDARQKGCKDIARQLVEFSENGGIDIALGGGRANFLPQALESGRRLDTDLIAEWNKKDKAQVVFTADELEAVKVENGVKLLGLFADSHLAYMLKRPSVDNEPTLSQMTAKAIDLLEANNSGYYLMVEGGRIDQAHHEGIAGKALAETQEFAKAVDVALAKVDLNETLILVTADHSHVFTMAGYPTRGNPILGLVKGNDDHGEPASAPSLAMDGKPFTTLAYANGPGAISGQRPQPATGPLAVQQATVPTVKIAPDGATELYESHGGEDVTLYAVGPRAHIVGGVLEQNLVFHIMAYSLGWMH